MNRRDFIYAASVSVGAASATVPTATVAQGKQQKQIGAADRQREHRQQFHLAIAVEHQAGDDQQLDLEPAQRRQVIGGKHDRGEKAELPRCEGHYRRGPRETWHQPCPTGHFPVKRRAGLS